jgi:hypothetical protein
MISEKLKELMSQSGDDTGKVQSNIADSLDKI